MSGTTDTGGQVERIAAHQYTFTSTWQLPASAETVFAVLRDLWSYSLWWPQFKRAKQTADDEGSFTLRSRLPLTLTFTLHRDVEDEASGLLRAIATGDIAGTVEWRLVPARSYTTAAFTEQVILQHRRARHVDFALRPLLAWNHRVAMRSGERGLIAYLDVRPPDVRR